MCTVPLLFYLSLPQNHAGVNTHLGSHTIARFSAHTGPSLTVSAYSVVHLKRFRMILVSDLCGGADKTY